MTCTTLQPSQQVLRESARDSPFSDAIISVENLSHTYDGKRFALKEVSLTVRRGEVLGLLGRNGAGKSTLIKILTTLIRPSSGRLNILGMDPLREGRKIRSRIGVVQQGESFDNTSVQRNFDLYGMLWGIPKLESAQRRENLIRAFGLESLRKKAVYDLSGGERRRVQVAREIMHDMDVLFLDEPTIGLDVIMRRELLDMVRREVEKGLTVVFTTHNLEEADYLCDRIAVIDAGRVLRLDTVENLKKLYGGKKSVEVAVGNGDSPKFFQVLKERFGEVSFKPDEHSALIQTQDAKEALHTILELSRADGLQIEWLNVRKNTLEDVFLDSISGSGS